MVFNCHRCKNELEKPRIERKGVFNLCLRCKEIRVKGKKLLAYLKNRGKTNIKI